MSAIDREIQSLQLQVARLKLSSMSEEEKALQRTHLLKQIQSFIELQHAQEGEDNPEDEVERVISFSEEIWNKPHYH